jgi:hypothetical protein
MLLVVYIVYSVQCYMSCHISLVLVCGSSVAVGLSSLGALNIILFLVKRLNLGARFCRYSKWYIFLLLADGSIFKKKSAKKGQ